MQHRLPDLPFPNDALEPYISRETFEYHHGKHHRAYVEKLNKLIRGTEFENLALEEIIAGSSGPIFNNAAQHWNHTFFWHCLTPDFNRRKIGGRIQDELERAFGGVEQFQARFKKEALDVFGSGWIWLVRKDPDGTLEIQKTSNAENPLKAAQKPILTCDLWEHAYYIDYRNERAKFLDAFLEVANWQFAERNLEQSWELAA